MDILLNNYKSYDIFENFDVISVVFWSECGNVFLILVFFVISFVFLGFFFVKGFIFIYWEVMIIFFFDIDICVIVYVFYNDVIIVINNVSRVFVVYYFIVFFVCFFVMFYVIVFCSKRNYIFYYVEMVL